MSDPSGGMDHRESGRIGGPPMSLGEELACEAMKQLEILSIPERLEGMRRYFRTSLRCVGVSAADLRVVAREAFSQLETAPRQTVLDFCLALCRGASFEARQLGYEVMARHTETMQTLTVSELEELGGGNDNWASVDAFATLITGILWQRGRIEDRTILDWADSLDPWWRRTALVSVVPLNLKSRGGRGDTRRTLLVADRLKADRHPAIVKALSWALRSLVAWDPEAVRSYTNENAAKLPARVQREVRNKLKTGVKNPGLRH